MKTMFKATIRKSNISKETVEWRFFSENIKDAVDYATQKADEEYFGEAIVLKVEDRENEPEKTYGETIDEITKKYCDLYDTFKTSTLDWIKDDPKGHTLIDVKMKIFVYEKALEEITKYIEEQQ